MSYHEDRSRRSSALPSPTHSESSTVFANVVPEEMDFESLQAAVASLESQTANVEEENEVFRRFCQRAMPNQPLELDDDLDKDNKKGDKFKKKKTRKDVRSAPLLLSAEHKVDIMVREIDEMRSAIEKSKVSAERHLEDLKAEMEEIDTKISEIKKDAYEFRRDIVMGAENTRTGKIMAEKLQRYMEDIIKERDTLIDKYRLKNSALKSQISKLETQLRQREEMGEVLLLIDFDQLRIENQQYIDRIEEKNKELLALKLTTANTVAILNALKEKLSKLSQENQGLADEIQSKRSMFEKFSAEAVAVKSEMDTAEKLNVTLAQQNEETKAPEVMNYIDQKAELALLEKQVVQWERKVDIVRNQIRVYRGKISQMQRTGSSAAGPTGFTATGPFAPRGSNSIAASGVSLRGGSASKSSR
eukprot:ANDGO_04867.mRNA.1 hypothetical protein PHYSODRAFT_523170